MLEVSPRTCRTTAADAAALLEAALNTRGATDRATAELLVARGRTLATGSAVEHLLDRAAWDVDVALIASALRFRGVAAVGPVLRRLFLANGRAERRAYMALATAVGSFPEITGHMATVLGESVDHADAEVARSSIVLLGAIGAPLPVDRLWQALRSPRPTTRLALVEALSRMKSTPDVVDLLLAALEDREPGLRFAAVLALGGHAHPRIRQALTRHLPRETDAATRSAIERQIGRVVARRSA